MYQGFIMLDREKGIELLEEDPQAFLLLTQIALRARRTDSEYSRLHLKANQAFLGDHKNAGLSRQEYRDAQKRLTEYNLAIFEPTNKGTIATLINTAIYNINAESGNPCNKPPTFPMEIPKLEPTKNHPETTKEPIDSHQNTTEDPVTIMEECKKTTTATQAKGAPLYACLQNHQGLSIEDKQGLMTYPEDRVRNAIEWASKISIKTTLIQTLHWYCKQASPPLPSEKSSPGKNPQEITAWEYNHFLEEHGQIELAKKNYEAIPQHYAHLISNGMPTTITLNNPIEIVKSDFNKSMKEIQNRHQNG